MKLVELNKREFMAFVEKSDQVTFYQSRNFGILMKAEGFHPYYLGVDDKGKIKAAALVLSRELPVIKKRVFYSPRGFVINYKDLELLRFFTKEIIKFAEKKNAVVVKIDPYVMYKQRDIDGNLVDGGIDNSKVISNLIELGYTYISQDILKPKWMQVINLDNKTLDDVMNEMDPEASAVIKTNKKRGIHVRELNENELPLFMEIMQKSNTNNDFLKNPISYYQNMWKTFKPDDMLKFMIAYIDFDDYLENTTNERDNTEKEMKDRELKKYNNVIDMDDKKYEQKQVYARKKIEILDKELEKIKQYQYEYGHKLILGCMLFVTYGNEVLSLYGGDIEKFVDFNAAYTLHFEGIKQAIEKGYKKYNFNAIDKYFSEENLLYSFNKKFGAEVLELIGEFDLIVDSFWYKTYQKLSPMYNKFSQNKDKAES